MCVLQGLAEGYMHVVSGGVCLYTPKEGPGISLKENPPEISGQWHGIHGCDDQFC